MLETPRRAGRGGRFPSAEAASSEGRLLAGWREGLAIVNLRGAADDDGFTAAAARALGIALPLQPCSTLGDETLRVVWAGPDDWFVIGPKGAADRIAADLRAALGGRHCAVTDVSSGYTVLQLGGARARDTLAQGCPLDLHPRVFRPGMSAGSLFFKASVWLWQTDDAPVYELLVRRSFTGYVWLMLERGSQECGLATRRFA